MERLTKILFEFYRRTYRAATPSADFDLLYETAPINDQGQREIDFMAYEIDKDVFERIKEEIISEYKLNEFERKSFNIHAYLGCSPRFTGNIIFDEPENFEI